LATARPYRRESKKRPSPALARGRAPNLVVPPQFTDNSRCRPFQVRR